ncbi:MAG TPA: 23S rRNA (adenine(2503)-C(2))-methyltransferase RlmN [Phycisphaerae bacterium]|jgi:23S rRNA (adenine2503-C2)-methyltransferase
MDGTPENPRVALLGLSRDALRSALTAHDAPAFRADQLLDWVYRHGVDTFDAMTNLPADLRRALQAGFVLYQARVSAESAAADGTRKLLLAWSDGNTSECVLIPDEARRTACISTQVGCPVGCVFCASGLEGVRRNLTAAEIVEQALRVRTLAGGLTNVVFMGLGEPLANYDATLAAIQIINADWGLNIGARKITVSTVGLPKQMRRLADEGLQINLALSVHAPTDELRGTLIPWAKSIPLSELVEACRYYFERTHREITLEYVLLGGVNDQAEHARQLARLAKQMRSNVNLIRYNPVIGLLYERPTAEASLRFQRILREAGVNTHLRRSRGLDIDAACGQLRRRQQVLAAD